MKPERQPKSTAKFWTREDHALVAEVRRVRKLMEDFKPEVRCG